MTEEAIRYEISRLAPTACVTQVEHTPAGVVLSGYRNGFDLTGRPSHAQTTITVKHALFGNPKDETFEAIHQFAGFVNDPRNLVPGHVPEVAA